MILPFENKTAGQGEIRGAFACWIPQKKAGDGHGRIPDHDDLYRSYDPLAESDRVHIEPDQKVSHEKSRRVSPYATAL